MVKLNRFACVLALAAGALMASNGFAATVFSDNFNSENGGSPVLNHTAFANWTVTVGAVDLIGNGYYDFLPGNGLYIDMDGSVSQAGSMESKAIALAAGKYELSFDLAGNQRTDARDAVTVEIPGYIGAQTYSLPFFAGFTHYVLPFELTTSDSVKITFSSPGNDNVGMLLDNVAIDGVAVPLPAAAWAGLALIGGIGAAKTLRRRHA